MIKTNLRYPGGKSRALKYLVTQLPKEIPEEVREPFLGGGSMFLRLKQMYPPETKFWINDIYYNLYCFWKTLQTQEQELTRQLLFTQKANNTTEKLKILFQHSKMVLSEKRVSVFERALCFFIVNRCSFSGAGESGGFSAAAAKTRFTVSSIERLKPVAWLLDGVRITSIDYIGLLSKNDKIFLFLDPPYDILETKTPLYGKNGNLHKQFDHERFYADIVKCKNKWMLTYNHSDKLIERYKDFNVNEWTLTYGMNINKGDKVKKELLIKNY